MSMKKMMMKSSSTKIIYSETGKLSHAALNDTKESKLSAEDVQLTPLNRTDFDQGIISKWHKIRTQAPPTRRGCHTAFIYNDWLYVIGGKDIVDGKTNEVNKINLKDPKPTWEYPFVKGPRIVIVANHTGSLIGNKYYIIGGETAEIRQLSFIYAYDPDNDRTEKIMFKPEDNFRPLESHTANVYHDEIIIFGGFSRGDILNTMYKYIPSTKKFVEMKTTSLLIPEPRTGHSSVIINDDLYVFGGSNTEGKLLNDLWRCDLTELNWINVGDMLTTSFPSPRTGHKMCVVGGQIYLFGGKMSNYCELNDFWKIDPSSLKFTLLHDTLLEQYSQKELTSMQMLKEEEKLRDRKTFQLVSRKEFEDRKNPFSRSYKGQKNKLPQPKIIKSQSVVQMKNLYDNEIYTNPGFSSMKGSSIFLLDDKGIHEAIENLDAILPFKIGNGKDMIISGHVPLPRDSHAMVVYEGNIVIFGGDRNTYPFNDLFMFKLN